MVKTFLTKKNLINRSALLGIRKFTFYFFFLVLALIMIISQVIKERI